MNEILYEESVEPKNLKMQKTFYTVYSILMWISIAVSIVLVCFGGLIFTPFLVLLILFVISAIIFAFVRTRVYYCVDYTFVSGSTRIIKVVNYKRRKKVLVFDAKEVDTVGKVGSETFEKLFKTPNLKKVYATPNSSFDDAYYVFLTQNGVKYMVIMECKETYLSHLVSFAGRNVVEKDYK